MGTLTGWVSFAKTGWCSRQDESRPLTALRAAEIENRADSEVVERWFAELTIKPIRRARSAVCPAKAAIQEFIDAHRANPKPFVWTKSADEILASIGRFAQRTVEARAAKQMSRTMVTGH